MQGDNSEAQRACPSTSRIEPPPYALGDPIWFWSTTQGVWIRAQVLHLDGKGKVIVNAKPRTWFDCSSDRIRPLGETDLGDKVGSTPEYQQLAAEAERLAVLARASADAATAAAEHASVASRTATTTAESAKEAAANATAAAAAAEQASIAARTAGAVTVGGKNLNEYRLTLHDLVGNRTEVLRPAPQPPPVVLQSTPKPTGVLQHTPQPPPLFVVGHPVYGQVQTPEALYCAAFQKLNIRHSIPAYIERFGHITNTHYFGDKVFEGMLDLIRRGTYKYSQHLTHQGRLSMGWFQCPHKFSKHEARCPPSAEDDTFYPAIFVENGVNHIEIKMACLHIVIQSVKPWFVHISRVHNRITVSLG